MAVFGAFTEAKTLCPEVRLTADTLPRDGSWLRKPLRSSGGAKITPWDHRCRAKGTEPGWYFQQRIDGTACSAVFVAAARSAVCIGVTRQLVGASGHVRVVFNTPAR